MSFSGHEQRVSLQDPVVNLVLLKKKKKKKKIGFSHWVIF